MGSDSDESAARQRLRANYTSILLAIYKIKGYAEPGDSRLGQQVTEALAGASPADLRNPENVSAATMGQLVQLAERAAEADRPRNIHGADAARLAQLGEQGLAGALGHKGYGELQRARAEARAETRSREDSAKADRAASSARFDGLGPVDWASPKGLLATRSYATSHGMSWATQDAELMRLGKPALQALHETRLQGDGYKALRDPAGLGFTAKTVVAGSGFMKRNRLDYNEAAKAADDVYKHKAMSAEDKAQWKSAVSGALHAKTDEEDATAKATIRERGSKLKEAHPEMSRQVDRAVKKFGADEGAGLHAKTDAKADTKLKEAAHQKREIKSSAALMALR